MKEIWKDIPGYEGLYQVSDFGRIKSLIHNIILKPIQVHGYSKVGLYKDKKSIQLFIHRIVALTFLINKENKSQVNHKDGIKTNNNLTNLEWTTPLENNLHAFKIGLKKARDLKGEANTRSILTAKQVILIKKLLKLKISQQILAKRFKVSDRTISAINCNINWSHTNE